jgi:DNA-binding MarR family transcriptional regulator
MLERVLSDGCGPYILYKQPTKMSIRVPSTSELPTEAYYRSVYQTAMNNALNQVPQLRIPNRYPRRRSEAQARRGNNVTLTPSGRVSRARLTPEQRADRRREVLRRNIMLRYPIRDILPTDVGESSTRPLLTPEERGTRKRQAVGTKKISAVRDRILMKGMLYERSKVVRHVTPARFPSVRSTHIGGECGTLPIMNPFRMKVYRHYVEHRNKGLGSCCK